MLIGLSSYIGGGKDTVTKMIQLLMLYHQPPITQKSMVKSWANSLTDIETVKEWLKPVYEDRFVKLSTWENRKFAGKLKQIVSLLTGIPVEYLEKQSVKDSELGPEWDIVKHIPIDTYWLDLKLEKGWTPPLCINCKKETRSVAYYVCDACLTARKAIWEKEHGADNGPMTVRTLLQKLGTEAMRDKVHPNIHVNALFADYKPTGEFNTITDATIYPNWILSDLRFPNELQAIKDRGGIVVRITRGKEYWNDPEWLAGKKSYSQPINLHPSETALDNAEFDYHIQNDGTMEELLEKVRTMLLHFKIIQP